MSRERNFDSDWIESNARVGIVLACVAALLAWRGVPLSVPGVLFGNLIVLLSFVSYRYVARTLLLGSGSKVLGLLVLSLKLPLLFICVYLLVLLGPNFTYSSIIGILSVIPGSLLFLYRRRQNGSDT